MLPISPEVDSAVATGKPLPPLYLTLVEAGFPSPAADYIEKTLDLNELCIQHPAATYFVRAQGNSMLNGGISPGDILVVDRALEARHGDIVIAAIDGAFTVKQLALKPRLRLLPMNDQYPVLEFTEGQELTLFGVVTFVIHSTMGTR